MSRLARTYSKTGVYHIVFRGVNQQSIFEEDADYKKLRDCIERIKEEMQFEIYAYCFMSNHVHIILKEKEMQDVSLIMKRILTKYARWYNIKYGRSGALLRPNGDVHFLARFSCSFSKDMIYLKRVIKNEQISKNIQ